MFRSPENSPRVAPTITNNEYSSSEVDCYNSDDQKSIRRTRSGKERPDPTKRHVSKVKKTKKLQPISGDGHEFSSFSHNVSNNNIATPSADHIIQPTAMVSNWSSSSMLGGCNSVPFLTRSSGATNTTCFPLLAQSTMPYYGVATTMSPMAPFSTMVSTQASSFPLSHPIGNNMAPIPVCNASMSWMPNITIGPQASSYTNVLGQSKESCLPQLLPASIAGMADHGYGSIAPAHSHAAATNTFATTTFAALGSLPSATHARTTNTCGQYVSPANMNWQPTAPVPNSVPPSYNYDASLGTTSFLGQGMNSSNAYGHLPSSTFMQHQNYAQQTPASYAPTFAFPPPNRSLMAGYPSFADSTITPEQIAARHVLSKDLPSFSGCPEEWPIFVTNYAQSTERCGFTDQENLIRLQRCLKGKALDAVRGKLMTPATVPLVIETLRMLYGRPEVILQMLKKKIKNEPTIRGERLEEIIQFALAVQNYCATVDALGLREYLRDPMMLNELVEKLPYNLKLEWGRFRFSIPTLDLTVFDRWLFDIARCASTVTSGAITSAEAVEEKLKNTRRSRILVHSESKPKVICQEAAKGAPKGTCVRCSKDHSLADCDEFQKLNRGGRWDFVKQKYLCQRCFGRHHVRRCQLRRNCAVDGCRLGHHPLLHYVPGINRPNVRSSNDNTDRADLPPSANNIPNKERTHCHNQGNPHTIYRILPVKVFGPLGSREVTAFIDEGSSVTLMESNLADELGVDGPANDLCLGWTGDIVQIVPSSKNISVDVCAVNGGQKFRLRDVRTMDDLSLPRQSLTSEILDSYPFLKDLPINLYSDAKPKLLIGLNNYLVCTSLDTRHGTRDEPIATLTSLGWTLYGRTSSVNRSQEMSRNFHICGCRPDDELHSLVKGYFSLDNFGISPNVSPVRSKDDERALAIMKRSTKNIGNRYETGLLWKSNDIKLPNSLPMAKRRLYCLEAKMRRDSDLSKFMSEQIADYLEQGFVRKLRPDEVSTGPKSWFLPMFAVRNPNKNKIRLVWDAAAMVDGVSLNTVLLKGPDDLKSLPGVLQRFREKPVAICGDIRQMFHQVRILKEDQHAQQFLWRDGDVSRSPDTYVMQVMTFGASCSPSLAQHVKNSHADQFKSQFPRAVHAIVNNHYVDDWLDCTTTEEEMVELVQRVTQIHAGAGFQIRNWISNSPRVAQSIGVLQNQDPKNLCGLESWVEKVLGLWWCPTTDQFTLKMDLERLESGALNNTQAPSKRQVLRIIMTVFDPLGFLAFFLVNGKILLREIWKSGVSWDEAITDAHHEQWKAWTRRLPSIANVRVPRCFPQAYRNTPTELHVFVDASINAYATVAYLRVEGDGSFECALLGSKTKVAPQKPMSVPRLELMAAVLGARYAKFIQNELSISISRRIFWSDSRNVLCWIRSEARKYRQFVTLRIGELLDLTDVEEWKWVPTNDNVTDDATKWVSSPEIDPESRWFKGPNFLKDVESKWPTAERTFEEPSIERTCHVNVRAPLKYYVTPDLKRFAEWGKLKRSEAYLLRFVRNISTKEKRYTGPLSPEEIGEAEVQLYRRSQWESFPEEVLILQQDPPGTIDSSSRIYNYSPYMDSTGVLRVFGRIDSIEGVAIDVKRPIILAHEHVLASLIVANYHDKYHHKNHEIVVNELRQRYAIPRLRVLLKKVRVNCQTCKIVNALPAPPQMGSLPAARLQPYTLPFSYTGVDYFGPIHVTVGASVEKRYGALFTCMTTRAVHLENAYSLSTDSFLLALKTFMCRRGTPIEMLSDQGTNFRGANRELKMQLRHLDRDVIKQKQPLIKWRFNPPASPHMGGSWERLVRSVNQT